MLFNFNLFGRILSAGILLTAVLACHTGEKFDTKVENQANKFKGVFPLSSGNSWEYFNQSRTQESFILTLLLEKVHGDSQVFLARRQWGDGSADTVSFEFRKNGELWLLDPTLKFEKETLLLRSNAKRGECGMPEISNCIVTENFELPKAVTDSDSTYQAWHSKTETWRSVAIKEEIGITQIRWLEYVTPEAANQMGLSDQPDKGAWDTVGYLLKRYRLQSGATGEF